MARKNTLTQAPPYAVEPATRRPGANLRTARLRRNRSVFGALRNASPDHWGRRIIERLFGSSGADELDYLLHSPDDRAPARSALA